MRYFLAFCLHMSELFCNFAGELVNIDNNEQGFAPIL